MPAGTIDGAASPGPSTTTALRRRIAALLAVAVIAAAGLWVHRTVYAYEPLTAGCCDATFQSVRRIDAPQYKGAAVYDYVPGGRIRWGFTILNSGTRAVRVTALPAVPTTPYMHRVAVDLQDPDVVGGMIGPWQPFRPFTLHGGESRQVRITYQFSRCATAATGSGFSWDRQPVQFDVWGVSRRTDVELNQVVAVDGVAGEC